MDIDSGVSDMTETESLSSVTSDSTIIGSPPSSVMMDDSEVRGPEGHFTLLNDAAASYRSVLSPESGIGSGSSSPASSVVMGKAASSRSVLSQDSGIGSGSSSPASSVAMDKAASNRSVLSQDSGIGRGSGSPASSVVMGKAASNRSVLSQDNGIGSGSGSGNGMKLGVPLPMERKDSQTKTQEWVEQHFEVFVKTLEGKTVTVQVGEHEEVTSFRKKVQEKTNVEASQQYLHTAEGRKLQDGERLSNYNIKKHSTIFCQGRLRGGEYY
ncbi:ubiquitin-like protein ISG15 isoform X2 [Biomphalaria glabrata]